jgi:hypothetical protein
VLKAKLNYYTDVDIKSREGGGGGKGGWGGGRRGGGWGERVEGGFIRELSQ